MSDLPEVIELTSLILSRSVSESSHINIQSELQSLVNHPFATTSTVASLVGLESILSVKPI